MHWFVAMFNMCDYTRFITDMTGQAFGFYVSALYLLIDLVVGTHLASSVGRHHCKIKLLRLKP